jgi:CubicO group peptidase (beta-lactamase class C family)
MDASSLASSPHSVAVRGAGGGSAEISSGRLGLDLAVSVETVMYAASIAKQIVGVLLAKQAVDGLVDPDDAIAEYIDDLPPWGTRVRLRHLIHHTAGLVDDAWIAGNAGNAEALDGLRAATALLSEPGFAYRYNNLGYICLAEVLCRTSGHPIEELAANLFERLGMSTARMGGAMPTGLRGQVRPPLTVGDGGLWLSAGDLRRWNDAMNNAALGKTVHALAEEPGALDDGTELDYAWGVRVFEHKGRRTISHGGSWPTWSAKAIRQPDLGVSVAIMTTSEDVDTITAAALAMVDAIAD